MKVLWALFLLVLLASVTISCGSGSSRQLQSITISQSANGQQIQFVATGTFSAPPITVSPLPVDWTNGLFAPPPRVYSYTLSTQPYMADCLGDPPGTELQAVAFAPVDPSAPVSGTTTKVVTSAVAFTCP